MDRQRWSTSRSTRLTALLAALVLLPAIALVWLGVRLIHDDRELVAKQAVERERSAVSAAARAFDLQIAEAERRALDATAPEGLVRFAFDRGGLDPRPAGQVLWVPRAPKLPDASAPQTEDIERLEQDSDIAAARARYEALATEADPSVRASALVGLARIARREHGWSAALDAYARLADVRDVTVAGAPADLQARRARCEVLAAAGRRPDLLREASTLEADFRAGRWTLDEPAWRLTMADLQRWTGSTPDFGINRARLSTVADRIWAGRSAGVDLTTARPIVVSGSTFVYWVRPGRPDVAFVVSEEAFGGWVRRAETATGLPGSRVRVTTPSGEALPGSASGGPGTIEAGQSETGLPWTVAVTVDAAPAGAERRELLLPGLGALLLFIASAGYFVWRVLRRELGIARLQSEFVAAVSHEFRTPLTAIRHVTDLLDEADDMPRERRRAFYGALGRSADRLQRLVESLLDFSRVESGRTPYDLKPTDATHLVASVVADFRADAAARGVSASITTEGHDPAIVEADTAALSLAIWNLVDNAVKYSPVGAPVTVAIEHAVRTIAIVVRDNGYGIPAEEQREIFSRFVRGSISRRLGIKGTGLGLAMVSHVAKGHRGTVELTSVMGQRSEFRLVLPKPATLASESLSGEEMEGSWRES